MRLVILSAFNSLISEDLAASVAEWDPAIVVRTLHSHTETLALLRSVPSVFAVLVQGNREEILRSGIAELAEDRGGRVVWIGGWSPTPDADDDAEPDWIRVEMPFGTEAILAALEAAARPGDRFRGEA